MLEAMPGIKCHGLETSTSSFGAVMATFNRIIFFFFGVYVLVLFSFSSALWIMERKRQMNDLLERRTI